jgi:hypothetical protein
LLLMTDGDDTDRPIPSRGCLATGTGAALLVVLAPFVVAVQGWKKWRRGSEIRTKTESKSLTNSTGADLRRIDLSFDVPQPAEPAFRQRLTDSVVRVAEALRASDDVYHLVYRLPWEDEPVAIPVGPRVQEFGERFALVQSQGAMAGRTAIWLTLGRDRALAEVVDPVACNPEADGEPHGLLTHPDLRWSMATEWARVGPSLIFRLVLVVSADQTDRLKSLLGTLH